MAERDALRHRGHGHPHAERISGHRTNSRADDNPFIGNYMGLKEGCDDGNSHAEGGQLHASPSTVRAPQGVKGIDEQERREQIRELAECLYHDFTALGVPFSALPSGAALARLNIDSIRSVIRKPPTMFAMAHATAIVPRIVASAPSPLPANTNEATREMPEIALVAAISGVCSSGGIRLMVWTPTKPASMKTNSWMIVIVDIIDVLRLQR